MIIWQKNLEPLVLKDEDGIEGFWVDKRNKTAYHVSKIGPVSNDATGNPNIGLQQAPKVWGELPPMDPRRALQPERMDHLEQVANFLYTKVGPLPEVMVRVRLRVFEGQQWASWKKIQQQATWAEAKSLIRVAATMSAEKKSPDTGNEDNDADEIRLPSCSELQAFPFNSFLNFVRPLPQPHVGSR
jgi:hypothetical protein